MKKLTEAGWMEIWSVNLRRWWLARRVRSLLGIVEDLDPRKWRTGARAIRLDDSVAAGHSTPETWSGIQSWGEFKGPIGSTTEFFQRCANRDPNSALRFRSLDFQLRALPRRDSA